MISTGPTKNSGQYRASGTTMPLHGPLGSPCLSVSSANELAEVGGRASKYRAARLTGHAEALIEKLEPLAVLSFESRAAAETAFASSICRKQQKG